MSDGEREISFLEHLEELRYRLIISVSAIILTTLLSFFIAKPVLEILISPIKNTGFFLKDKSNSVLKINIDKDGIIKTDKAIVDDLIKSKNISDIEIYIEGEKISQYNTNFGSKFYYFSPMDPFMLMMKTALLSGLILAVPIWLWQLWAFLVPALTIGERKIIKPILFLSVLLFPSGAAFAYFMLRYALLFFTQFNVPGLEPRLDIFKYISFALTMMMAFGIIFEMPVVIILLIKTGILSTKFLREKRAYAIVIIMFAAAILTPPDPFSMIAMALPLLILYEFSILAGRFVE